MTQFRLLTLSVVFLAAFVGSAVAGIVPNIELEKKIAYQQGQFGALYAHCASNDERAVIGGSLDTWRIETFQGYKGNTQELATVQAAFDSATRDVTADDHSCQDWIKQAAATWRSIITLSEKGLPVVSR
jgi:hypothetical protein